MHAAAHSPLEIVQGLLDYGVDPKQADSRAWTALHYASQEQRPDVAGLLIDHGAEVDARDQHGMRGAFIWEPVAHKPDDPED
jgi:uncharacterized protein